MIKGVTPRMLAWWFSHLEGFIEIGGIRYNRYRVWHPFDHVHASYARRLPDGTVGPGAAIRLREVLGRHVSHVVNVTSEIEKLDEEGFVHCPAIHVARALPSVHGLARMEYSFQVCSSVITIGPYEIMLLIARSTRAIKQPASA
ncbi:MAG: hypothetical protein ABI625_11465 [bacterium]